mgnify:CR=1 FL=1
MGNFFLVVWLAFGNGAPHHYGAVSMVGPFRNIGACNSALAAMQGANGGFNGVCVEDR